MLPKNYFPSHPAQYFQLELSRRQARRPQYSMRAFARDLSLSPSRLSELMNGKGGLSGARAIEITQRMNLDGPHAEHFSDLMESIVARTIDKRNSARLRATARINKATSQLKLDKFEFISDWYHLAILELIELSPSYHNSKSLAKALKINKTKIDLALVRLIRLDLLKCDGGNWEATSPQTNVGEEISSKAIQHCHRQVLKVAANSLKTVIFEKRLFQSVFFSARSQDIPRMKEDIDRALKEIVEKYHCQEKKDVVFTLSTQLFQLAALDKL